MTVLSTVVIGYSVINSLNSDEKMLEIYVMIS